MSQPKKKSDLCVRPIFSMPPEILKKLNEISRQEERTKSSIVRRAIEMYIRNANRRK